MNLNKLEFTLLRQKIREIFVRDIFNIQILNIVMFELGVIGPFSFNSCIDLKKKQQNNKQKLKYEHFQQRKCSAVVH